MKLISLTTILATLLVSAMAWAAPVVKYSGNLDFPGNVKHKSGVSGVIKLMFEGDQLTQIVLTTTKPIFGQSEFPSTEQTLYSNTASNPAQMAAVFKFDGPPHEWFYVMLMKTADAGKTYSGVYYKANGPVENIKKGLDSGTIPSDWTQEGKGDLTAQ